MTKINLITTQYVLNVIHNDIEYECTVSYDFKDIISIIPEIENIIELANIIRDAAMDGNIENLN